METSTSKLAKAMEIVSKVTYCEVASMNALFFCLPWKRKKVKTISFSLGCVGGKSGLCQHQLSTVRIQILVYLIGANLYWFIF